MTSPPPLPSGAFRRQLAAEVQAWHAEGLITPGQAELLELRYALKEALQPGINKFTAFLYGLGALLIGGGVISFIAFNWDGMPDMVKVVGLLTLMLFFQGVGFFWMHGARPALGHALLLLGSVMFGANIGLFGQIFGADGHWSNGFALWALGCTMIAYSAGSIPTMALALFASGIAYTGALKGDNEVLWSVPVLVGLQGVPFALRHGSSLIFFIALNLFAAVQFTSCGKLVSLGFAQVAAMVCGMLMLTSAALLRPDPQRARMARTAQVCGVLWLSVPLFFCSIGFLSEEIFSRHTMHLRQMTPLLTGLMGVMCLVFFGPLVRRQQATMTWLPMLAVGAVATLAMFGVVPVQNASALWTTAVLSFATVALVVVWTGLLQHDRLLYSLGTFLLGARLIAFFLLYNTGLLMKSLFLVVGGIVVIVVALQFERWAARLGGAETTEAR